MKNNNYHSSKFFLLSFLFIVFPLFSLADGIPAKPENFSGIVCLMAKLALDFVPLVIALAVVFLIQELIKYVANGDNEEKRAEGTKMMIYGVVGLFFMVGVWGVLTIFTNSFGMSFGIPQFKSDGSGGGWCNSSSYTGSDSNTQDSNFWKTSTSGTV